MISAILFLAEVAQLVERRIVAPAVAGSIPVFRPIVLFLLNTFLGHKTMNSSNFLHAFMGLVMQLVIAVITGNWWYGAFLAAGLFWGREHDQKQHNIAKATNRTVKELKWYEGADMTKWSLDSLLDFFFPLVATVAMAFLAPHLLSLL